MSELDAILRGGEGDADRMARRVAEWSAALTERMAELSRERLEGADRRGVVRARVSGEGRLLGLSIDPRGMRGLDHAELAQAVTEAIAAARTTMGERLTELTADLFGPMDFTAGDPLAPYIQPLLREE